MCNKFNTNEINISNITKNLKKIKIEDFFLSYLEDIDIILTINNKDLLDHFLSTKDLFSIKTKRDFFKYLTDIEFKKKHEVELAKRMYPNKILMELYINKKSNNNENNFEKLNRYISIKEETVSYLYKYLKIDEKNYINNVLFKPYVRNVEYKKIKHMLKHYIYLKDIDTFRTFLKEEFENEINLFLKKEIFDLNSKDSFIVQENYIENIDEILNGKIEKTIYKKDNKKIELKGTIDYFGFYYLYKKEKQYFSVCIDETDIEVLSKNLIFNTMEECKEKEVEFYKVLESKIKEKLLNNTIII